MGEEIIKWNLCYEGDPWEYNGRLENWELDKHSLHPIYFPRHSRTTEIFIQQQFEPRKSSWFKF